MKTAKFYIMPPQEPKLGSCLEKDPSNEPVSDIPAHFIWACQVVQSSYQQRRKLHLLCENEDDANLMDELIWQLDVEHFVPHTLPGEGPAYGAPVSLIWQKPKDRRPLLINLSKTVPDWAQNVGQIIDFVPSDEAQKELARERYKHYRQLGYQLETQQV